MTKELLKDKLCCVCGVEATVMVKDINIYTNEAGAKVFQPTQPKFYCDTHNKNTEFLLYETISENN